MSSSRDRRILTRVKVSDPGDEIVISGVAGRFPNSANIAEFTHNLYNKIDMVDDREIRWKHLNEEIPKRFGNTVNLDKFDAQFFSIHYRQAHNMDPQARMLQEHAYEAIIDAGVAPRSLRGSRTGVFIGCCMVESDEHFFYGLGLKDGLGLTGASRALLANRISFAMDFKGPSFTIDTACSSSGYALDLAFNALRNGECDAAIVGGANLLLHPATTLQFARLGVLNKNGYCRPFDKDASGYCRSEAINVLFLQKKRDAKRIYANLVYSKTNVDGFKNEGLTYPSGKIQIQLLDEFYQEIGIDPKTVDYVESHSTGTKVGDPEECFTLDTIFCTGREGPLPVGSVKSNMGHTEASSSISSIMKSILIFETGKIPPNIHYNKPRPGIPSLEAGRLQVVAETRDFDGSLISVNSFGFGGANAHALLRRNEKAKIDGGVPKDELPRLVLWSGRTEEAVNSILESVVTRPLDAEYIALLQNVQTETPASNTYRGYGIFAQPTDTSKNATCVARHIDNFASSKRPLVFVYSGMGSQWPQMGADLMQIPLFAAAIDRCHKILATRQIDLKRIITSADPKMFDNILHSFVGIAAIQIGLTDVLKAIGLQPDYIIGHSVGELGCAYADGCITDEEMLLASYSRGRVSLDTKVVFGAMAAVGVGYEQLKEMLVDGVEIACHNSSDSCTISGPAEVVSAFVEKLKSENFFAKEVQCSNIAYHSSYIADMGPKLFNLLEKIIKEPKERSSKWISSSVPKHRWEESASRISSAAYHTNNLLSPVLFEEASECLPKNALTIEIAPHGLLQAILKRSFPDGIHVGITKRGDEKNALFLMSALGRIFENGVDMDIGKLYPPVAFPVSCGTPMISSLVKWDHSVDWFVPRHDEKHQNDMRLSISLQDTDYEFISGHEIDGRVLFPATGYLFLAWKLAVMQHKQVFADFDVEFEDVKFLRACNIPKDSNGIDLSVVLHRGTGRFEISEGKAAVVTGIVRPAADVKLTEIETQKEEENEEEEDYELTAKDFYKELRLRGYHYKNLFKSVVSAKMDGSSGRVKWEANWIAFLDCLLQLQIIGKDTRSLALPTGIRRIVIKTREHLKLVSALGEGEAMRVDFCSDLNVLRCGGVEIRGLQAQCVGRRPPPGIPVLESYKFVPHFPAPVLSVRDIARFCVQLAIENLQTTKILCVEVDAGEGKEPLSEHFGEAIGDLPLVTGDLNFLSTRETEIAGVKTSAEEISTFANCTFVVRSNCLSDAEFFETIAGQLSDSGFILSRESKEDVETFAPSPEFKIVAILPSESDKFVLIQHNKNPPKVPSNVVKITNRDFSWLPKLKASAKSEPTIAFAQGEELSGIVGLVNCIRKEPSGSNLRCFFIDDKTAPPFDTSCPFYSDQLEKNLAVNVFRDGKWGSFKHLAIAPTYEKTPQKLACFANSLTRGDLSSIKWLRSPLALTSASQRDIVRVQFAALNFRDVMLATGKLSADTIGGSRTDLMCVMGLEFAGVTGSGRRVMGLKNSGTLATHVEADDVLLWDVPDSWSLEDAATVPCVYSTVYAAFFLTTQIQRGKSILIHAGSGGIGLAAIRVAFAYGLEVFTTVSTEEKRAFLLGEFPQLRSENIGNSRDTSFEELVMRRTRGRGVDYVLNSLAEEKLLASVRCLGKGGKFLEIGKFDMASDNKLGLGDFLRELTFHAILVDNFFKAPAEEKAVLKQLLDADLRRGIIKPLKTNVFRADEVEQAFRLLASGKHIGKVLLQVREHENDVETLPIAVLPRVYCNPLLSYVICGGLGGFGLELADWLVLRGCRKLVLSSSRGVTKNYQRMRIKIWESYGAKVVVSTENIATREGCSNLITAATKLGPVGGIFNLAVKLRDSILENQNEGTFEESLAPKAIATEHLDEISRTRCPHLHCFVVFSSVSCGRGNAGQSNYGMANSVMERIVERRARAKLPAKAIQWGAVGEVGIVADMQEDKLDMEIGGTLQQRISSCLEELDTLLSVADPVVASMVVAEKRFGGAGKGGVVEMIMNIMSIKDAKTLSLDAKLSELGMDSLMTVEISQALEREFNLTVTPQELRSMTFSQLKAFESDRCFGGGIFGDEMKTDGLAFLLRNLGDEANSAQVILKVESLMNEGYTKALIVPGIEGTGGKIYYNVARSLKYPTYLLQIASCWHAKDLAEMYAAVIEDVLRLYENESTFLLVGYSFGALLTLKLAKTLESLGVTGKVILIDGAPELLKRLATERLPSEIGENSELIQALVLENSMKFVLPNDTSDRLKKVLLEASWEGKMRKIEELYTDFTLYSMDFSIKSFTALLNRTMMLTTLDLKSFQPLSTPITLVKPTETSLHAIDADYGLRMYATASEIDVHSIRGNHMSVLENPDLPILINDTF